MPEQFEQPRSIYQNEAQRNAAVAKLGRKITDVVKHKVGGVKTDDPEYWGLIGTPQQVFEETKEERTKAFLARFTTQLAG